MGNIQTNRDLYRAISELIGGNPSPDRTLEVYLRALWASGVEHRDRAALSGSELFGLLAAAFTRPAPPFDEAWRRSYGTGAAESQGFPNWERCILRQIVDLREMAEKGMLDNELRYFGMDTPRGGTWYNFDPYGFLECAAEGTFGGWRPGDPTGRKYVPGPVAVPAEDGQLREVDPREIDSPAVEIPSVTWDDFREFLENGQSYE